MNKRFPIWLHLRLSSQDSIDKHIGTIKRMFTSKFLPLKLIHFKTDKTLEKYLKERAMSNPNLRVFLVGTNANDDSDNDDNIDDIKTNDTPSLGIERENIGYATVTHEITSVGYYAEFLGCTFIYSNKFIKRLATITKYLQQSDVSMNIQDNSNILLLFEDIHNKLRKQQTCINERIIRWLKLGNLAESPMSLIQFGLHELQPFIELCLRYLFLPMTTSRLQRLRMVLLPIPSDINELYDLDARAAIYAPLDKATTADDLIFIDGDHLTHVSMVYSNNDKKSNTYGKLVARPIEKSLSVYIFFFFKYCKGNWNTQVKRTHTVGETHPLFSGIYGGEWKYLMQHVRDYGGLIGLPVENMGLKGHTSSYMHQSRVAWVASRASNLDINQIAVDSKSVKMGFAQEHKFYPGLESLRMTQRARDRLGDTSTKIPPMPSPSLSPLVPEMYPLLMEMQGIEGNDPVFPSVAIPPGSWLDNELNNELYSKEYLKYMNDSSLTVKQYMIAERGKINRKSVNMERRMILRSKKRYKAIYTYSPEDILLQRQEEQLHRSKTKQKKMNEKKIENDEKKMKPVHGKVYKKGEVQLI